MNKFHLQFHITDECNLNCGLCSTAVPIIKDKYIMSFDEFRELFIKLHTKQLKIIYLLGGEPTMHENFEDMCLWLKEYFPNVKLRTVTNGYNLLKYQHLLDKFDYIGLSHYPDINNDVVYDIKSYNLPNIRILERSYNSLKNFKMSTINKYKKCHNSIYYVIRDYRLYPCCSIFGFAIWNNIPLEEVSISLKENNWEEKMDKLNILDHCIHCPFLL
jgi:uncharacterized radical SAM superfamily Fe-S cluster-containing enzyme